MSVSAEYHQALPDLAAYRSEFSVAGVALPLPCCPTPPGGLLARLPPPPGRSGWPWTVETLRPDAATDPAAPTISIVVPSYRQGRFIEETLRSVLLQNYPRLQVIVIDGGSNDETARILDAYRPWLSFVRQASDRGQAHAINLGLALADGRLRGWLNSDDLYLPGTLHRVAAAWRRTGAEFVYGDQLVLRQETGRLEHDPVKLALDRYVKFPGLVASHASFWTAERQQPVWEEQCCAIDYELWVRLLPGTRKCHVPWPLGLVRHHAGAKTFAPEMTQKWQEDAERNGRAHPRLYRRRPWLDFEYRYVQGLVRRWRRRASAAVLAAIRAECGWTAA